MGLMTLAEMRVDVARQMLNRTTLDPTDPTAQIKLNLWINRALRWVALPKVFRHPGLFLNSPVVLVLATQRYALPSNLYAIRFVINETKEDEYRPILPQRLLRNSSSDRRFARDGNDILFNVSDSTNGDTVRIYYWAYPTALTMDGSITQIEDYFDQVIIDRATSDGCAAIGELQRSDFFRERAAAAVNEHAPAQLFEGMNEQWMNDLHERNSYQRTS